MPLLDPTTDSDQGPQDVLTVATDPALTPAPHNVTIGPAPNPTPASPAAAAPPPSSSVASSQPAASSAAPDVKANEPTPTISSPLPDNAHYQPITNLNPSSNIANALTQAEGANTPVGAVPAGTVNGATISPDLPGGTGASNGVPTGALNVQQVTNNGETFYRYESPTASAPGDGTVPLGATPVTDPATGGNQIGWEANGTTYPLHPVNYTSPTGIVGGTTPGFTPSAISSNGATISPVLAAGAPVPNGVPAAALNVQEVKTSSGSSFSRYQSPTASSPGDGTVPAGATAVTDPTTHTQIGWESGGTTYPLHPVGYTNSASTSAPAMGGAVTSAGVSSDAESLPAGGWTATSSPLESHAPYKL